MLKIRCITYKSDLNHSQVRQNLKKYQSGGTKLSINDNTKSSQI